MFGLETTVGQYRNLLASKEPHYLCAEVKMIIIRQFMLKMIKENKIKYIKLEQKPYR